MSNSIMGTLDDKPHPVNFIDGPGAAGITPFPILPKAPLYGALLKDAVLASLQKGGYSMEDAIVVLSRMNADLLDRLTMAELTKKKLAW